MKYVLIVLLVMGNLFAEYSEGYDTTESDGTGLESAFQIGIDDITALNNTKFTGFFERIAQIIIHRR